MLLTGKTALITGGTSGIGKAIALEFAKRGAFICVVGRNKRILKELEDKIENCIGFEIDLLNESEVIDFKKKFCDKFEGLDFLIHSAGIIFIGGFEKLSLEEFDLQYNLNVRAPYLLTSLFLPLLIKNKGCVVFINSSAGLVAKAGVSQYSATKHALKALADSLREEVNSLGVRVISVYPGQTATPMQKSLYRALKKKYDPERLLDPHDVACILLDSISLSNRAEVTDIKIRPFLKPK